MKTPQSLSYLPSQNIVAFTLLFIAILFSTVHAKSYIEVMQETLNNMPSMQQKEVELEQAKKELIADFADRKKSIIESHMSVELHSHKLLQTNEGDVEGPSKEELAEFEKVAEQKYQEDYKRHVKALEKSQKIQLNGHKQKRASIERTIKKETKKEQDKLAAIAAKGLPDSIHNYFMVTGRGEIAKFTSPETQDKSSPLYDAVLTRTPEHLSITNALMGIQTLRATYVAGGDIVISTVITQNKPNAFVKQCEIIPDKQTFSIGQPSSKTFAATTPSKVWPLKLEQGNRCEIFTVNKTSCKVTGCFLYMQYNGAGFLLKDEADAKVLAQQLEKTYLSRALSQAQMQEKMKQWQAAQANP